MTDRGPRRPYRTRHANGDAQTASATLVASPPPYARPPHWMVGIRAPPPFLPHQPALPPPSWRAPFAHLLVYGARFENEYFGARTAHANWGRKVGWRANGGRTHPPIAHRCRASCACVPPFRCALPPACSHPPTSARSPFTTRRRAETGVAGDELGTHERDGGSAAPVAPFAESGARRRSGRRAEVRAARHSSWRGAPPQPSFACKWGTRMGAPRGNGNGAPSPLRATRQHERSARAQMRCPPPSRVSQREHAVRGGCAQTRLRRALHHLRPRVCAQRGERDPGTARAGNGMHSPSRLCLRSKGTRTRKRRYPPVRMRGDMQTGRRGNRKRRPRSRARAARETGAARKS